jgi:hypothetical protein
MNLETRKPGILKTGNSFLVSWLPDSFRSRRLGKSAGKGKGRNRLASVSPVRFVPMTGEARKD